MTKSRFDACGARLVLALIAGASALATASAATLYLVAPDGGHAAPFACWATAATNIQAAVELAHDGDMVLVAEGRYVTPATVDIDRGIMVVGFQGAAATEINGADMVRCFNVRHPEAVLEGFTITAGRAFRGGGVWITNGLVRDCVITGNFAQAFGGGVDVQLDGAVADCVITDNRVAEGIAEGLGGGVCLSDGGHLRDSLVSANRATAGGGVYMFAGARVTGCTIVSNLAWDAEGWGVGGGGGVACNGADTLLLNCLVAHNTAQETGGGVYLSGHAGQKIVGGLIHGNTVGWFGGGVYANLAPVDQYAIESCTIVSNRATHAVHGKGGGIYSGTGPLSLRNCIVYHNHAESGEGNNYHVPIPGIVEGVHNCTLPILAGAGNMAAAPLLTDDFRLSSNSPCINLGLDQDWMAGATDLDGKPRIIGNAVDIGACEYGDQPGYARMALRCLSPTNNQVWAAPARVPVDMRAEQEWGGGGITQTVVRVNGRVADRRAWNFERYCMLDFDGLELEAGFYYMSLEAWDAHGRTARTAVVFTVSRLVPLAPEDFSVTRGTTVNAVRLAWSPPDDAETYEIWRADHAAGTSARLHAELAAPADAYLDADVIAGRRYGYQVRALNRFGSGDFSPIVEGWSLLGPAVMGNGRRHELELPAGERRVTVALLLGAGAYAGMDCDWWVVAHDVNAGRFYYLDGNMEFQPLDDPGNLRPARQGPLFDIEHPFALLTALPAPPSAGSVYRFYFGIDTVMNGRLDEDWLTYDTLQLLYR